MSMHSPLETHIVRAPDVESGPVIVDGPFLRSAGERFVVRGVTYGTFAGGADDLLPAVERVDRDFAQIAAAGFNTVRTYVEPRTEVLDLAAAHGLRMLVGIWWQDDPAPRRTRPGRAASRRPTRPTGGA